MWHATHPHSLDMLLEDLSWQGLRERVSHIVLWRDLAYFHMPKGINANKLISGKIRKTEKWNRGFVGDCYRSLRCKYWNNWTNFFGLTLKNLKTLEMEKKCFCLSYVRIYVQECESWLQVLKSEVEWVIENLRNEKNKAKLCQNFLKSG